MPAAVRSAFAIVDWFNDRARHAGEPLQPLRLQQLLFVAQGWYAARHAGRALMPAVFVADELGPVEPNVLAALAPGRPRLDVAEPLPVAVETLLQRVWRTYGSTANEDLLRLTTGSTAYRSARARGPWAPIALAQMADIFAGIAADASADPPPSRLLRTQNGRSVRVGAWLPPPSKTPDTS